MTADSDRPSGETVGRSEALRERLAAQEHERWSKWQSYLHGQCVRHEDGSLTIPAALVERWERQIATPYAGLSEVEKDSDRAEADATLGILSELTCGMRECVGCGAVWDDRSPGAITEHHYPFCPLVVSGRQAGSES